MTILKGNTLWEIETLSFSSSHTVHFRRVFGFQCRIKKKQCFHILAVIRVKVNVLEFCLAYSRILLMPFSDKYNTVQSHMKNIKEYQWFFRYLFLGHMLDLWCLYSLICLLVTVQYLIAWNLTEKQIDHGSKSKFIRKM